MIKSYSSFRRILQINRIFIDLFYDVLVAKFYKTKGLKKRSLGNRVTAEVIRWALGRQRTTGSFPIQFRKALETLGPSFVKFGQILSIRDDIIPSSITKELKKLQNRVPPVNYLDIKKVVESEFNMSIDMIFNSFDSNPIAAASLAQAHIATLKNGKRVLVKVQRPGIVSIIINDIRIMRKVAGWLEKIPGFARFHPMQFVDEFAETTMNELDFTLEAKNAEVFRENFKNDPEVIFPEIFWDFTTRRVLTMQYIEGINPNDEKVIKKWRIDGGKLAGIGTRAILKMLFVDGFFHADPHPGNVLIFGRSKLGLVDMGMVGRFSLETKKYMFLYFYYLVNGEYDVASNYILKMTTSSSENADIEGFQEELAELIKRWPGTQFKQFSIGKLILETLTMGSDFGLVFNRDLFLAAKAIITIEGVGAILKPDLNLRDISRPYMQDIFRGLFSPVRFNAAIARALPEYMDFMEKLPSSLINTVSMVSDGKFQIEWKESKFSPSKEEKKGSGSSAAGIVAAGGFITGAILSISQNTPGPYLDNILGIQGMPLLAVVFFGGSLILGIWSIMRKK